MESGHEGMWWEQGSDRAGLKCEVCSVSHTKQAQPVAEWGCGGSPSNSSEQKQCLHPPLARVWCLGHEGPAQGGVGLAAEGQWVQQGLTGGDQKGAEVVLEDLEGALCSELGTQEQLVGSTLTSCFVPSLRRSMEERSFVWLLSKATILNIFIKRRFSKKNHFLTSQNCCVPWSFTASGSWAAEIPSQILNSKK